MMVQKMIHANDRGNPKIKGVAEEKSGYPGQIMDSVMRIITTQKMILTRYLDFTGSIERLFGNLSWLFIA